MSDFRKLLLAFAAVTLLAGIASAQVTPPITCSTTAQPLTVRTEGLAEQTGDVVISCTGGQAPALGTQLPQVNISLTLSTNITSRLLNDPITEALLFIDDPAPTAQAPCAPASGSTVCAPLYAGAGGTATVTPNGTDVRNVFQGVKQSDNTIVWLAVPINAPGSTGSRVLRTKNVRAAIAGSSATNGQIFAFVSIQNPPANLQINQSSVVVAFVQQGLIFDLRSATAGSFSDSASGVKLFACERYNSDLAADPTKAYGGASFPGGRSFQVRFRESYAASFKVREVPGGQQNIPQNNSGADPSLATVVESGFFNTNFTQTNGLNRAGRADTGTRLQVRFNNVPANVRIYVSTHAVSGSGTSGLAAGYAVANTLGTPSTIILNPTSTAEVGPPGGNVAQYPIGYAPGLIEVPLTSGSGSFVWEVFGQDPNALDSLSFAVALAYRNANNPGLGQMTVNGSFAPVSSDNKMSTSSPLPRFADQSTAVGAASINICQTNLLFPFVSNQGGFDTGIAISNTSQDPYGTSPQSGNCELNYYGGTTGGGAAPSKQTTTSAVAGGAQAIFTLSSGGTNGIAATPGFQGYIIAICNFRFAHGFAFISDVGAQRLSHGYLALILDPRISNTAESLGQ